MARKKPAKAAPTTARGRTAESYEHKAAEAVLRPDVGVQKQFKAKKPPKQYRYDSSLSPTLEWDEQPARVKGEALISKILDAQSLDEAKSSAEQLKAMSRPFLNWAGKAERQTFEVPTLPLFVHERLSTKAILETVKVHAKDKQTALDLFGDPQRPIHEQLRAYEHRDRWVNRMILGDSLVVMNSLLE
ncbi:MAG: site-specific DNA-methyltransferase, partial [Candidatus Binatia bacterium]